MAKKKRDLRDIIQIDSEINKIQDADILLERILLEARKVVNADAGSIYVKDGDKLTIQYSQNDTLSKRLPPGEKLIYSLFSIPIDKKTISGYVAATSEIVNIPDVYNIPSDAPFSYNTMYDQKSGYISTSNLTVPLKTAQGELLGVIQFINARGARGKVVTFTQEDEMYVTHFAANATVALQRAYMTRSMILRMIMMSELRDPKETGPHVNRVAGYAVELYERWAFKHGISDHELNKQKDILKLAAMLHDVGKVAISDLILKKPAKFTEAEYAVMQGHTYHGARLFESMQSDLDRASVDVAMTHHENWDGTGYPGYVDVKGNPVKVDADGRALRRKGQDIPLYGRLVSIADVFDALISRRVYKDPWTEDDVLNEIRRCSGTKFDPELVDIFFEILPQIQQIRKRYPDTETQEA